MISLDHKKALEILLYAALLVGCVFCAYLYTLQQKTLWSPAKLSLSRRVFEQIPKTYYQGNNHTAIIFLSKGCAYCTISMPFYRQLKGNHFLSLVVIAPHPLHEIRKYLADYSIEAAVISDPEFKAFPVETTPTLVIVNNLGIIEYLAEGSLDSRQEEEVMRIVNPTSQ